jgi:hypothetical protein
MGQPFRWNYKNWGCALKQVWHNKYSPCSKALNAMSNHRLKLCSPSFTSNGDVFIWVKNLQIGLKQYMYLLNLYYSYSCMINIANIGNLSSDENSFLVFQETSISYGWNDWQNDVQNLVILTKHTKNIQSLRVKTIHVNRNMAIKNFKCIKVQEFFNKTIFFLYISS